MRRYFLLTTLALAAAAPARADVVINEIFYNAPDDLDALQFIELHNTGDRAVNLAGWKLARAARYEFPAGSTIDAGGYLVLCKDRQLFKQHYGFDAAGPFDGALGQRGAALELLDAAGKKVDAVKYGSRAPWPAAADGEGPSLERVCPAAPAEGPENWAPSPLPEGAPRPAGSPGKRNANYAERLPPVITDVAVTPAHAAPDTDIKVAADVRSDIELRSVELRYRVAGSGFEKREQVVPMTRGENGRYAAAVPGQKAGQIVRLRVRAVDAKGAERYYPNPNEVRPALSVYVHDRFSPAKCPFGLCLNVGPPLSGPGQPAPARGNAAYVHVDATTGTPELFDFVNVVPRHGGHKVRFHKDRPLDGMTTVNLIYEWNDRMILAEHLAYEVYRQAGNAACRTDFVRTFVDGRPLGVRLLVEQPNKAFLRRNRVRPDGNLYKIIWYGSGVVGQHEKKTRPHDGHDDVVTLVRELNATRGDAQWAVIKKNFDVEQVINYFAVNMLLSHWDGYFNNYYAYHDVRGSGKWTMYPWDQDKTWGFHDGLGARDVFFTMPVSFGMNGDRPVGGAWWRPAGYFSGPLLANPRFRKLFLARTRELAETVYTPEVFFPLIKEAGARLEEEVRHRARVRGEDPKAAVDSLRADLDVLRQHLTKRREWLLAQGEIKNAGKFDRDELK